MVYKPTYNWGAPSCSFNQVLSNCHNLPGELSNTPGYLWGSSPQWTPACPSCRRLASVSATLEKSGFYIGKIVGFHGYKLIFHGIFGCSWWFRWDKHGRMYHGVIHRTRYSPFFPGLCRLCLPKVSKATAYRNTAFGLGGYSSKNQRIGESVHEVNRKCCSIWATCPIWGDRYWHLLTASRLLPENLPEFKREIELFCMFLCWKGKRYLAVWFFFAQAHSKRGRESARFAFNGKPGWNITGIFGWRSKDQPTHVGHVLFFISFTLWLWLT